MKAGDKIPLEDPLLEVVGRVSDTLGWEAYVIGGYVRDLIMDRGTHKDIDVVVVGSGIELARRVSEELPGKNKVQVFKNFGTAMIRHGDTELEFVGARKESYRKDSRKPVVENGSLSDDQKRRDFTINALAIGLNKKNREVLLDPFKGLKDMDNRVIRTPLDPDITFSDDPLRMMRAIRFATQLGFDLHPSAFEAIQRNKERLRIISRERISDELNKIMESPKPSIGFRLLDDSGLLELIIPQLLKLKGVEEVDGQTHKDNFYHTLQVLDNMAATTDNVWSRWAALLHDIGKPRSKKFVKGVGWTFHGHEFIGSKMIPGIFKRLRMPTNEKLRFVQKLVRLSSRPTVLSQEEVTDSAVRRLLFEAGEDIDELMLLCEADITTKNKLKYQRYLDNFQLVRKKLKEVEERDHIRNFQPPISGELIMDTFDIEPGRQIGDIKNAIREAILDGEIENDYEQALNRMLELGQEMGLQKKEKK
jgi:tRNA nucleotidyltransferase (CCA-adding enzyme)